MRALELRKKKTQTFQANFFELKLTEIEMKINLRGNANTNTIATI